MKSKPRHLLHVLVEAPVGGCERASEHLCRYLPSARHTVLVLGGRGEMSAVWERLGAHTMHLDVMRGPRAQRARAFRAATAAIPSDGVVVWHGMVELPLILHALPAACGPILVYGGNPATGMRPWVDWRYLLTEKFLYPRRHDPLYTCCSQYVADSFVHSRYLRRFRRCAVTNGVDPLSTEAAHTPRALSGQEPFTIGMLARLDVIKDHATLLRAFAEVRQSAPGARLELAGDGDHLPALKRLAAELGLGDSVRFLGTVKHVYERLPRWDVFAYATTVWEGFGIALAEALMCGLPAVVTDVGPVREVCGTEAEGAVLYVPPHDPAALAAALGGLIGDLPRRQALSAAARRRATTELSAEVFARRYEQILAHGGKAPPFGS